MTNTDNIFDAKGWILDIDDNVVEGRLANSGAYIIKQELKSGHPINALKGVYGALQVQRGTKRITREKGKLAGDNWGLSKYHDVLKNVGIGEERVIGATLAYIHKHQLPGIGDLLNDAKENKIPYYFASTTSAWHTKAADIYFDCNGCFSNPMNPDGTVKIITQKPEDKLLGIMKVINTNSLEGYVMFGDSDDDVIAKKYGAKFAASPLAPISVKRFADFNFNSYKDLKIR